MFDKAKNKIVLVADEVNYESEQLQVYDRIMDRPHHNYIVEISDAIRDAGYTLVTYNGPDKLLENIHLHREDLVFPYWYGENSRNRHSLVPAICEAASIKYVGGDVFAKTVCNDKQITKLLCRDFGLDTPDSFIITSEEDLDRLESFPFPYVLKPMYEGTSMGISDRNLITSHADGLAMARELLEEFQAPVLAEAFARGKEASIGLLGYGNQIKMWSASERILADDPTYFYDRLNTFSDKNGYNNFAFRQIASEIPLGVIEKAKKIFEFLDKVEYMRVDGRLYEGKFQIIELTPESHLGSDVDFCGPMMQAYGKNYSEIIDAIICNCLERYHYEATRKQDRRGKPMEA